MSEGGPATVAPAPTVSSHLRLRRGRVGDAARLVRLYMGLSEDARHGFHPFPFHRAALWFLYPAVLTVSRVGRPLMRRFPRLIVVVVVAEIDGVDGLVGYGTLRGETPPGRPPEVRFGFVVRDGFRGYKIGVSLLRRLAEEGYALGIRTGVGAVFRRDARAIKAIKGMGWEFRESTRVDPRAPEEENYETVLDLARAIQAPPPSPTPPPAANGESTGTA